MKFYLSVYYIGTLVLVLETPSTTPTINHVLFCTHSIHIEHNKCPTRRHPLSDRLILIWQVSAIPHLSPHNDHLRPMAIALPPPRSQPATTTVVNVTRRPPPASNDDVVPLPPSPRASIASGPKRNSSDLGGSTTTSSQPFARDHLHLEVRRRRPSHEKLGERLTWCNIKIIRHHFGVSAHKQFLCKRRYRCA